MTRYRHHTEHNTTARTRGTGRVYLGAPEQVRRPPIKPVEDGEVTCPECGGGVRLIKANFTDLEADPPIQQGVTRLIGNHGYGGGRWKRKQYGPYRQCGGSGRVPLT
jgi:hypothetical protein